MSEFLAALHEVSEVLTYSFVRDKFGKHNRMHQMGCMIAIVVEIAMSVCRLTVYGSVICVNAVIF